MSDSTVKPLEWQSEDNGDFIAQSAVGWFHVGMPASYWSMTSPSGEVLSGFNTHHEAKAAVQADYERRILSALSIDPASLQSRIQELEEALKELIGVLDNSLHHEVGAGGMSLDAQIRRTIISRVPAIAVEQAREALSNEAGHV